MITSEIPKLKYFHHFDQSEVNPAFHRKYFVNDIGDRMTINQDEIEKKCRQYLSPPLSPKCENFRRRNHRWKERGKNFPNWIKLSKLFDQAAKGLNSSNVGSVVEFSPATREARVRFPDVANVFYILFRCHQWNDFWIFQNPYKQIKVFVILYWKVDFVLIVLN